MKLLIIAAGNGSRLGNVGVPKALMPINGLPNLVNTISHAQDTFESIEVIIGEGMLRVFDDAITEYRGIIGPNFGSNVNFHEIKTGLGSGQAVKDGITKVFGQPIYNLPPYFIFAWGDAVFSSSAIFDELINHEVRYQCPLLIPVIEESKPYLSLDVDGDKVIRADFTKPDKGYHDQSVFKANTILLTHAMNAVHQVMWDTDHYTSDVGEFSFMSVIQYLANINANAKIYLTENKVEGYNTLAEVRAIENTLLL